MSNQRMYWEFNRTTREPCCRERDGSFRAHFKPGRVRLLPSRDLPHFRLGRSLALPNDGFEMCSIEVKGLWQRNRESVSSSRQNGP